MIEQLTVYLMMLIVFIMRFSIARRNTRRSCRWFLRQRNKQCSIEQLSKPLNLCLLF